MLARMTKNATVKIAGTLSEPSEKCDLNNELFEVIAMSVFPIARV
jgi:hypothetical protein